ncbi:MAG: hypothetical protein R2875_09480 [Desulfobacterales bacterium]
MRPIKKVDTLIVNGCECEPYLTADDRLMRDIPDTVISGALLSRLPWALTTSLSASRKTSPRPLKPSVNRPRARISKSPY